MSNDPTIDVFDNSDLDLTGVSLRDPVLDQQWVLSRITNLYWEALKSDKTPDGKASQLVIELATEEPATSTDGKPVPPGIKARSNIYATPVGGLTQAMVNKKLARFQTAALGLDEPCKFGPSEQYVGKTLRAFYSAEQAKDDPTILYQRVSGWRKV